MLHLSRLTLLQMVLPIWAEIFLCHMRHHHESSDSYDKVIFLESPLFDFLIEDSDNSSLIELDLMLSLQSSIVQSY